MVRVVTVYVPAAVVEGSGLAGCGGGEVAAEDQRSVIRPAELRGVARRRAVVGEAIEAAAGVGVVKRVTVQMGLASSLPDVLTTTVEVALRGIVLTQIVVKGEKVLSCRVIRRKGIVRIGQRWI